MNILDLFPFQFVLSPTGSVHLLLMGPTTTGVLCGKLCRGWETLDAEDLLERMACPSWKWTSQTHRTLFCGNCSNSRVFTAFSALAKACGHDSDLPVEPDAPPTMWARVVAACKDWKGTVT